MHESIESFKMTGVLSDANVEREKARIEKFFTDALRDEQFIPVLDIDPQWSMNYDFDKDAFVFELTVYCAREEDSWAYAGLMDGKLIPKYTPAPK